MKKLLLLLLCGTVFTGSFMVISAGKNKIVQDCKVKRSQQMNGTYDIMFTYPLLF
jgi:hypothetical protein